MSLATKSESEAMSHLLLNRSWRNNSAPEKLREAADKGINPEATVFSTLSQSVLAKRCSVMITTCVYATSPSWTRWPSLSAGTPFTVMTNHRTQDSGEITEPPRFETQQLP